jgi:integrase
VIKLAVVLDYINKDPFILHKNSRPRKKIIYLNLEELRKLEAHRFASFRLQQVADMFIFCCYTGLAFAEMSSLKRDNIITGFDGEKWIKIVRQKTDKELNIPVLSKALEVLDKYKNDDCILPIISNQKFNSYLKEIANIVGIDKHLTHHIGRKTFATTILLYNDIPMEIVSELLGHSSLTITQNHYAKVVQTKVNEHIKKLDKKLK